MNNDLIAIKSDGGTEKSQMSILSELKAKDVNVMTYKDSIYTDHVWGDIERNKFLK